ncbi:unnamed protein product [Vicia faba]|uniref:Uncharacterized protein n=1 Tax=Vicia faba TaxID=3906 RepID=A0AAV0ZCA4_VICFA|nr:unnamed protein product [Vicia faba]
MGNYNCNEYIRAGPYVSVWQRKEDRYIEEGKLEIRTLSYFVGYSLAAQLISEMTYGKDGLVKLVRFKVDDSVSLVIDRAKNNLLNKIYTNDFGKFDINFVNETKNSLGEVIKTNVAYDGFDNEGILLVVEQKRKSGFEKPYVVTLAHYYAINSSFLFGWKTYDAGISMVVNIRVFDNDLDVICEGSSAHASWAFLDMFQHVSRTRFWRWMTCPYYAAETDRRERSGMNSTQVKNEMEAKLENDDEEGTSCEKPKQRGNVLANQGMIKGRNNGNLVVKNLYLGRRNQ